MLALMPYSAGEDKDGKRIAPFWWAYLALFFVSSSAFTSLEFIFVPVEGIAVTE